MAGGSSSLSQLVLLFVTICLISFASFVYFTSFRHPETAGKIDTVKSDQLYNDLASYVKSLEEAIVKKEKKLLGNVDGGHTDVIEDHLPPKFEHHSTVADSDGTNNNPNHPVINKPEMLGDAITTEWVSKLSAKLLCLRLKKGGIYLYHTRKAAGTSIRDVLTYIAAEWKVPYYETEGVVLHPDILKKSGLLSVTSLREPVSRIMSLYWYEHVGWYSGVLKQTERCKSLKTWVAAWRDGSQWKDAFIEKNPDSVYVEIDNYYVKMLSNWHARQDPNNNNNNNKSRMRGSYQGKYARVIAADLEVAKGVLRQFDIVLLSDWMGDSTQIDALNSVFPGRSSIATGHKVRGDHNAKMKLVATLAPDEEEIRALLTEINSFDLQLFEYAQTLMAYRLKFIPPTVLSIKTQLGLDSHMNTVVSEEVFAKHNAQCSALDYSIDAGFKKQYMGIFQPPGHKGPF